MAFQINYLRVAQELLFNNSTDFQWKDLANIPEPGRDCAAAVQHGDKIYLVGGYDGIGPQGQLNSVAVFNTSGNHWYSTKSMKQKRQCPAAAVANNRIYVATGNNGTEFLNTVEVFDVKKSSWTAFPYSLPTGLTGAQMVQVADGQFVLCGGAGDHYLVTNDCYSINVYTNHWMEEVSLAQAGTQEFCHDLPRVVTSFVLFLKR